MAGAIRAACSIPAAVWRQSTAPRWSRVTASTQPATASEAAARAATSAEPPSTVAGWAPAVRGVARLASRIPRKVPRPNRRPSSVPVASRWRTAIQAMAPVPVHEPSWPRVKTVSSRRRCRGMGGAGQRVPTTSGGRAAAGGGVSPGFPGPQHVVLAHWMNHRIWCSCWSSPAPSFGGSPCGDLSRQPRGGARGNPVRPRDCPAAVFGNDRRQQHWVQPAPGKRRPVGTRPAPAGRLGDEDARESEDLPAPVRDRGRYVEPRGTACGRVDPGTRTVPPSGSNAAHLVHRTGACCRAPTAGSVWPCPLAVRAREERV